MSGERYRGRLDHIAAVAAEAGFPGLEPEVTMLGRDREPEHLSSVLREHRLELAALALAEEWRRPRESEAERSETDEIIALLSRFPDARLVLVQLPWEDRSDLAERQRAAIACMNAVARRALDAGVRPTVHPNSPPGSLFRTADDYELLLDRLDAGVGFTPDLGHVAAGGMDPLETVMRYRDRVDHLHLKDLDAQDAWAPTGAGRLDFPAVVSALVRTGYDGWVVFEDESEDARRDPDGATRRNGAYAREVLLPALARA